MQVKGLDGVGSARCQKTPTMAWLGSLSVEIDGKGDEDCDGGGIRRSLAASWPINGWEWRISLAGMVDSLVVNAAVIVGGAWLNQLALKWGR